MNPDLGARLTALPDRDHRIVLNFVTGWYTQLPPGPVLDEFEAALTAALDILAGAR